MSVEATIAELRVRLSLTQGSASLLLVVCPTDVVLAESHALLLAALRATPMTVVDLGVCAGDEGPERWAARTRASAGEAYLLTIPDRAPLAMRGFAQLLNAQRQLLRGLAGPVVLLMSRAGEQALRRHALDFFTWIAATYEVPGPEELRAVAAGLGMAAEQGTLTRPAEPPIRFLHLSDLHLRPAAGKKYDQGRVLEGLLALLEREREAAPLDLIFVTGDLAQSGRAEEYAVVVELLQRLLEVSGVAAERMFVVPGNHDVDRGVGRWLLRTLSSDEQAVEFFVEAKSRVFHERKLAAYAESMGALLGSSRPLGLKVGGEAVEVVEVRGVRLAIAAFNTAWFAQGDDDHEKLWLGEANVQGALERIADEEASFAIALMHHPFRDLHPDDAARVEPLFERGFDAVLRGHLHKDRTRSLVTQRGGYVELAAPAAYQGSQWQNGCFFGEVRAQARTVCLRPFKFSSGADPWVLNTEVFPDDAKDGYQHTFTVPAKQRVKSGRSRALRAANKAALAAMPEVARRELVQMVTGDSSASEKARESVAAELLVESPEAWKTVLGQEELGVAMIDAITRAGTGLERRIAVVDEASLREALLRAGRMYLEAMPTQAFRRRRMAYRITGQMLLAALELVVDGEVAPEYRVNRGADRLLADMAIIAADGSPFCVIEVKHTDGSTGGPSPVIEQGLAQVARCAGVARAKFGVLVLLMSLEAGASEPKLVSSGSIAGVEVLILHL